MADPKMASADDIEDSAEIARTTTVPSKPSRNACTLLNHQSDARHLIDRTVTELMQPKPQPKADLPSRQTTVNGRDGLAAYTEDPSKYPQSRVVYYDDNFVVINDLFPKSVVHMLILPRDKNKNIMHPTDAFDDPNFLALCREEEKKVRAIAAAELQRRLGQYSAQDRARLNAMDEDEPPEEAVLPAGRNWDREIITGIHANPSMNHLHIHVLSKDLHSEKMKKSNHYQSFTTDFFVRMDQFPLAIDDHRRDYRYFPEDLMCWRCGKGFRRKFTELKKHLDEEFERWKRE